MAALYAIVQPAGGVDGSTFAIVADDDGADYVFTEPDDTGLNADRVKRSAEGAPIPPEGADGWFSIAASNLGYYVVGDPQQASSMDDARTAAAQAIQDAAPREPTPAEEPSAAPTDAGQTPDWHVPTTRAEVAQYQANAAYTWSQQYPEAADGEVDDPEADLELRQLMTPPVDPTKPHQWLPIAVTETDCGFCDQPQEAAIHNV